MHNMEIREKLQREILELLGADTGPLAKRAMDDPEILAFQEQANAVSIRRLGMNDHGPVHMRIAARNSIKMLGLLAEAGVKTSLETEWGLSLEHSRAAVFLGSFLHDLGMGLGRDGHEEWSVVLARPIISRMLQGFPRGSEGGTAVLCVALEGIAGHMATRAVSSIEAGLVLVGDGTDMEHGRSRAPARLFPEPKVGDMHQYSADAVEAVEIGRGEEKPIGISIRLRETAGFFQVENVLFPKIENSPVKRYIELSAGLRGSSSLRYL